MDTIMGAANAIPPTDAKKQWAASVLRAEARAIARLSSEPVGPLLDAAESHGVLPLVDRVLRRSDADLPASLREELAARVRFDQSIELARRAELGRVVDALHRAAVPTLLLKGAALAHTHYPAPHLRPRVDTDILVRPDDRSRAGDVLTRLGYAQDTSVNRDAIFTQSMFRKPGVGAVRHMIDLHWKISNRQLFRDLLSFDELERSAVQIGALGAGARTPGSVHSLLLACIHPVAHHRCEWPLIWLYDIALVAERLDTGAWSRFRELARVRQVSFICRSTFELVSQYLGERPWLRESGTLAIPDQRRFDEPSAAYLEPQNGARQDLLLDLKANAGLRAKARLLLAHAFPDSEYMRAEYAVTGWVGMTAAYTQRIANACLQLARS